jgi:hypothetical protein
MTPLFQKNVLTTPGLPKLFLEKLLLQSGRLFGGSFVVLSEDRDLNDDDKGDVDANFCCVNRSYKSSLLWP